MILDPVKSFLVLVGTTCCSLLSFLFIFATMFTSAVVAAQEKTPVATSDKASPPQLSGTVVDSSGAVIVRASVQVRSANGIVQMTTQTDAKRFSRE